MALFADEELAERRRQLQKRKPRRADLTDVNVPPGAPVAGQAARAGAQSVTPGAIRNGTISGVKIKNGTITAPKIVAGEITAREIKAGSITANEIDTDTLTADTAFIGSIKAGFIGVNQLEAEQIHANSITSVHINTLELFASEATIGHLESGLIGSGGLVSGTVAAGTVTAAMIGAGTISTATINVGGVGSSPTAQIRAIDTAGHVRATMDASGFAVYDAAGNAMWNVSSGITSWGISPHSVATVHVDVLGLGTDAIAIGAVITDRIYSYAVIGTKIAGDSITAAHIAAQKITGINIYASGFSNNEADSLKKFVLDANGIHLRTSNNQTSAYQFLDFFDGSFQTRAWVCYDFFSGFDQLRIGMVGNLQIDATRVNIGTALRVEGPIRIVGGVTGGEYRVEGSQVGLYVVIRARAAAAAHWYGTHCQFRGRRVDGSGNGAAPSSLTITQTLQSNLVTAWDVVSTTSYGSMISVGSTGAGDIYYAIHVSTN